ncbi:MAG: 50S ribosomal protein L18 [Bacilli bacterium]|nr:50S ribosomal protein L18 [Bacilli bacterium]
MISKVSRNDVRVERHKRVRTKVFGTHDIPRVCVFKSNTNIYAQIINDEEGITLVSASSLEFKDKIGSNVEAAKTVGENLAKKAKKAGITKVVFDRGGYLYHGRVKALADAMRDSGLEF